MLSEKNPLESLVVDEETIAEEEITAVLKPYIRFTKNGDWLFESAFEDLSASDRTCVSLLAAKALSMLAIRDRAAIKNVEIVEVTGMPQGTVNPKLAELREEKLAIRGDDGWEIPTHALRKVINRLSKRENQ